MQEGRFKKISFLIIFIFSLVLFGVKDVKASISERLSGKILLQVEANGEAWYVKPDDRKRVFLSRPEDAFNIMREFGLGISNSNLEKIPSQHENFSDGFDLDFSKKQAGKILLQVEKNGEAYYINPDNYKKYYLGRPGDAFELMRQLGLGISNKDLFSISSFGLDNSILEPEIIETKLIVEEESKIELIIPEEAFLEKEVVEVEEVFTAQNLPWDFKAISPVYKYQITSTNLYDPSRLIEIKIYYPQDSYNLKEVLVFDDLSKKWRKLKHEDNIVENYISFETSSLSDQIILMEDEDVMTRGRASWYKYKNGLYAASPDYPKGSILKVTNLENDKSVNIVINDYGPDRSVHPDRVIDLDYVAFEKIASPSLGIIDVKVELIELADDDKVEISSYDITPNISANSALVINEKNGKIIFEKNSEMVVPIASLTKLVFAQVFLNLNPDFNKVVEYKIQDEEYNEIYCQPKSAIKMIKLEEGEQATIKDLFYSAIMYSANNAVETLVRNSGVSRNEFISLMNKYVKDLGAKDTKFIEPTGLSPNNVSSAKDYAIISKEIFKNTFLNNVSSSLKYSFKTVNTEKDFNLYNTNKSLVKNDYKIISSKTGYLHESGYCLVTKVVQNDKSLIVVNLDSSSLENRENDNDQLAKYGFKMINL